jgi:hypothetical protein
MNMNKTLSLFIPAAALCCAGCAGQMATWENDSTGLLLDKGKSALCLPLDSLRVTYVDNTKSVADTLFNDSFFVQAVNGLLSFEVSQNFTMCRSRPDTLDSLVVFRRGGYSVLDKDTANLHFVSLRVQELAKKHNADIVVVPYACEIRHVTIRPAGWRRDRFGPAYERPVSYTAKTSFHVQVWDKTGRLIYERTGKSDTGRPILYSFLKREKIPDRDIVKYAKRFYAPPLVKSLYNSIKLAMMVKI